VNLVSHVEFLIEEQSMETSLRILLPRMLPTGITFAIYPSNGKEELLQNLPARFRGYSSWLPADWRIIVLIDRDDDDCRALKSSLETIESEAGMELKSNAVDWQVANRIAVEELEAWYWGDMDAVRAAYPRIPATIERQAQYRDPDAIRGGTWEALERILQRAGYFSTGIRKLELAREISRHMVPDRNRSASFRCFRDLVASLATPI
jgi:hypothetical protein